MSSNLSQKVSEGWLGPGRSDGKIVPIPPSDDGLHTRLGENGSYEWWYFDAHLESGHIIVAFFYASNPNPGSTGKTGVELTLIRPDGRKTQRFIEYPPSDITASTEKAEVKIGGNYLSSDWEGKLPIYKIHLDEGEIGFDLTYTSQVNGWKPGSGSSVFSGMGEFSWVVPVPRAVVQGTIRDGGDTISVNGIGYHDHNWLNFPFQRIIEYWMWGRVYSTKYTISYALIQCNKSVDRHAIKVLMIAENENVIVSTGEYDLKASDFEFSESAGHSYPRSLTFSIPGKFWMEMRVRRVLEAVNMLNNFGPGLRFLAKYVLRLKPGYFRILSDFKIKITEHAQSQEESGSTLHEIVAFKPIE